MLLLKRNEHLIGSEDILRKIIWSYLKGSVPRLDVLFLAVSVSHGTNMFHLLPVIHLPQIYGTKFDQSLALDSRYHCRPFL